MIHTQAVRRKGTLVAAAFLSAALMAGAAPAGATDRPFRTRSPEGAVERLSERLDLTPKQAELLLPVLEDSFSRRREIEKKYEKMKRDLRRSEREERRTVADSVEDRLEAILSAEQMEEYRALKDERRARRGEKNFRKGRDGGKGNRHRSPDKVLSRLSGRLDLTVEQEDLLLPILEENFARKRDILEHAWEENAGQRQEVKRQIEDLDRSMEDRLASVLTAEQMEEYRELREDRPRRRGGRGRIGGRGKF